ncbi:hypothetical protein RND81_07G121300 [Saponaria officinalis]|uniref:Endoplasmic reticulum transmembrane protein n=1 Tax=Saponaria officinalis TaxID=3572 RepID=A0AAW1JTF1_SAPOF
MINLLFSVILAETTTIMFLLFNSPLRKLIISGIDMAKRGRGPIVVKTVASTILVVLSSSIYSVFKFTRKTDVDDAAPPDLNPTEQVLFAKHLLESSLMGFILFLALMIDRLHYYIRELDLRRKTMEAVTKKDVKFPGPEDIKARERQVDTFKDMIRQMESELETKIKEASSSGATVEALRKQSEGLLLEYDRLLAENQELRNELQIIDRRVSHSAAKKDSGCFEKVADLCKAAR